MEVTKQFLSCQEQVIGWGGVDLLRQFISRLHNIVHIQWIYRNTVIHYRGADGLTNPDHHKILNRIKEYSSIDPDSLLLHHCYLFDTNFESLGSGPMSHRLLWLAEMDAAFADSCLASAGTLTPEAVAYFSEEHPGHRTGFIPLHEGRCCLIHMLGFMPWYQWIGCGAR